MAALDEIGLIPEALVMDLESSQWKFVNFGKKQDANEIDCLKSNFVPVRFNKETGQWYN